MGGGSKKLRWKRETIVEDIREKLGYGSEFHNPPVMNAWDEEKTEKKKSVRSVVKGILKKGKKEIAKAIGTKDRSSKNKNKGIVRSQPRVRLPWPVSVSDGSVNQNSSQFSARTSTRGTSDVDRIMPANVLPMLSDTGKQAEAASRVNTPEDIYHSLDVAGPSTAHQGTSFSFKHFQWGPTVMEDREPVGATEVMHDLLEDSEKIEKTKEATVIEDEQDITDEEEEEFILPGAVPFSNRKSIRKPFRPTYQRRAESEMRNALEKAEEEDRKSLRVSQEMQDKRSQLIRIRQAVEAMKREREIAKKEKENDAEIVEKKKEKKRRENEKTYLRISITQKAKIAELSTKLNWLAVKQEGKMSRINSKEEKNLNLEQKMKLKSLKQSSKRLQSKMVHVRAEISRRFATIERLTALREKCKTNPNPMEENPTFTDFELASIPVTKCWKVKDDHIQRAHGSQHRPAPPPTPAVLEVDDLVRPFNEQPDNQDETPVPVERPLTSTLAKRFNPKALVARLQHHLSKRSRNSRPLGAHPGRLRSVTENMQEIIPYEAQHYDSDPEGEVTMVDKPIRMVSQSSHTAKHMVPSEHAQRRSDRHYSRSSESELELEDRQINAMGRQLENSCHSSCDTPNWRRMSMRSTSNEVPEFELVENSWSSAEHQMNDRDLLAMFDSPKRHALTIRPKTRRSQRLEETKTDIGAEVDRLLENEPGFDDTCAPSTEPSNSELLAMFESPKKPLTNKKLRRQRTEEASQRRSLDTTAEVDDLLEDMLDLEVTRASNTAQQMSSKGSPRPLTSIPIQQREGAAALDISSGADKLLENELKWEGSTVSGTSYQMANDKDLLPKFESPSLDNEAEIDRLLDGEIEWEEFCAPRPVEGKSLAKFKSPKKPVSMGQRRRDEAVRRYFERCNKASSSPENQKCLPQERCRNPVTRQLLNPQLADSSRLRH